MFLLITTLLVQRKLIQQDKGRPASICHDPPNVPFKSSFTSYFFCAAHPLQRKKNAAWCVKHLQIWISEEALDGLSEQRRRGGMFYPSDFSQLKEGAPNLPLAAFACRPILTHSRQRSASDRWGAQNSCEIHTCSYTYHVFLHHHVIKCA